MEEVTRNLDPEVCLYAVNLRHGLFSVCLKNISTLDAWLCPSDDLIFKCLIYVHMESLIAVLLKFSG